MSAPFKSADALLDFLEELFITDETREPGGDRLPLSAHMLQTAAKAVKADADDALVAASLLHDVGHWLIRKTARNEDADHDPAHETVGEKFLQPYFDSRVTRPISLHVAAKRYLCAREPRYFARLSAGSVCSLETQGGAMTPDEAARFESVADFEAAVALRRWDEYGKIPGLEVPRLGHYRPLLKRLVRESIVG